MTVVDEKAKVPKLNDESIGKLARVLDVEGVVAAMLVGSQARGTAGPLSDVDIAYWHSPDLDRKSRRDLRLQLISAASTTLGTNEVDVVPLNHASPLFRHRATRDGKRFLVRDPRSRVRLEANALIEYLDTEPLRDIFSKGLRNSIRKGRFGRRPQH